MQKYAEMYGIQNELKNEKRTGGFGLESVVLRKEDFNFILVFCKAIVHELVHVIFVCDHKIELASSIVTDRFISLSMISKEGRYYNHEMVSFEKTVLAWGQELFNYYKDLHEQINQI